MSLPERDDSAARKRAANDLKQNLIVDAGAGTGKTTVLVSRIVGAVITGKSDLEHIVAITFTEKAAGELKVRLRFELERELGRLEGEGWKRVRQALADIERAQVATIHSFCAGLLRERPVEARVEPDFKVLDELGANLLSDRTWEEWLSTEMDRGTAILEKLLRSAIRMEEIYELGKFLLYHRDLLDNLPSRESDGIEEFLNSFHAKLEALRALQSSCKDMSDRAFVQIDSLKKHWEKLSRLGLEGQREYLLHDLEIHPAAGNQKNWRPAEKLAEIKGLAADMKEEKDRVRDAISHNRAVELFKWLSGFISRYDEAKRAEGSLDFFDLLYRCRDLLRGNQRVRQYFQDRFDYILVDEFQDTDPLQIEILFFLAEKSPRAATWREVELRPGKLFLVGDPKQSIYRFRRADIEAYHEAKQHFCRQGDLLDLSLNFRSRPLVVDWVNALFSRLIHPPEDGFYQPAYHPITASLDGQEGSSVWILPLAPQISAAKSNASDLRLAEARTVAAFLKRIVEEEWSVRDARTGERRAIRYGDVGILFRTKEAIDLYEEEFRDFEIPYRVAGGRRYYSRLEMTALLALLTALDNPKDGVAVAAALRSPFFGVSDEELFIAVQEGHSLDYLTPDNGDTSLPPAIREAVRCLRELRELRNQTSVSLFLHKIYETTRILPLLYLKPQGDQKVANLLKTVELARGLEERGLITLRSFVQFLKKMEANEAEEGESPLAEESEDALRIMTIHKAKGLEFPLVMLADVAYERRRRVGRGMMNRAQGCLEICVGSQERGIMTKGWRETSERERLRGEAEDYRLLYVAATRARDYLVLPFFPGNNKKRFLDPLWSGLAIKDEIPWGREIFPFGEPGPSVAIFDSRTLDTEKRELRPFRIAAELKKKKRSARNDPSRAQLRSWERKVQERNAKGRAGGRVFAATEVVKTSDQESWSYGRGAAFGSFVHDLLRAIDFQRPDDLRAIAQTLGKAHRLDDSVVESGIRLVEWGLGSSVLRRAARSSRLWKELPFVYPRGDHLIEGFIDLVFEENGELVVVDFKTDRVEKEKELEERVRHYAPQGIVYAMALEGITHKKVKEVVFLFVSAKLEKSIPLGKSALQRVEKLLKETTSAGN